MGQEEQRQQAERIGDNALEFNAGKERTAYIEEACGQDDTLKALVLEYIAGADDMSVEPVIAEAAPVSFENKQIGPWKLLRPLGEGGFGLVYLAERNDGQVRQLGAVKFLKGTVYSRDMELRFLDERQILANLHHPWIVGLIDAGLSAEGQPYLVMDYVDDALPIDVYCREKDLSAKDRLLLFQKVCDAVAYAHRKLVVHRDLKPSNILVTKDGSPRLLDFGVAKILDPIHRSGAQAASSTYVLIGTERYFSPEQVRREPVDTSTDIYTLGVILYELLVGADPYDLEHHKKESVEQLICSVDPELPSKAVTKASASEPLQPASDTPSVSQASPSAAQPRYEAKFRRQLKGDLDNILLMALRKEPQRRYASVNQFSDDIRRHLEGLPVSARGDTFGYRASKFVQRHKTGVAAAALIVVSLIAGLTTTVWQARRAQAAQAKAERRFNEVRKLASSNLFEFHDEIAKLPGTTAARALVVKGALQYLNSLAKEASGDRDLQLELATAYQKVGDAQGRPGFANIGDRTGALESYRQALAIRKAVAAAGVPDLVLRRDLATNYERIGDTLLITGQTAEALSNYREALALRKEILSENPGDREARREAAGNSQRMAQALAHSGKLGEAQETEAPAVAMFQGLAAEQPGNAVAQRDLFIAYIKRGNLLTAAGKQAEALNDYKKALPIAKGVESIAEDKTRAKRETATAFDWIGNSLAVSKDVPGALHNYQQALELRSAIADADPNNAEVQRDLSISHEKIGNMLARSGDTAGALAQYRQSLSIDTRLAEGDPGDAQGQLDCAESHENVSRMLMKAGDLSGALTSEDHARKLRENVAAKDQKNTEVRSDLAATYQQLGSIGDLLAKKSGNAEYTRDACNWYGHGLEVMHDLQQRGALGKDDLEDLKTVSLEVSKCETVPKATGPAPQTADFPADSKK
jgi:serine/threonine protein kinase/predicted negative regulator of RcsB-dependent stress response